MEEIPREEELFHRYLISLNKANKLNEMMQEIHSMTNNRDPCSVPVRSFKESFYPEPSFFPPNLAGGKNAKMPNVSKKIKLINNGDTSALVAKKKIYVGDVLLLEKGAIVSIHPTEEFTAPSVYRCHHCNKIIDYFVTCPECDVVVFCGYKCRYYSWNEFHRWECYAMKHGYFITNRTSYNAMRMLFFGLQFEETALSKDYYNKEYNFAHFANLPYDLQENNSIQLFTVLKECVDVVLYLKEHTQFFQMIIKYPKYENRSEFKLYSMVGGLLLRSYFQFQQNCIDLNQAHIHALPVNYQIDFIADGLFLSAQWFTRSAHPNTVWFQYENYLIIKACKEISPGDKITVRWKDMNDCDCNICITQAEFNSFLCKRCNSVVRPVEESKFDVYLNVKYLRTLIDFNEHIDFLCTNCNKPGNFDRYKKSLVHAQRSINIYCRRRKQQYLDNALAQYKKVLHPNHIYFVSMYTLHIQFYLTANRELPEVVDKSKEVLRILELQYGKISKVYVNAQIYILYQLTEYFKRQNSFTKDSVQYCQSLVEQVKPAAKFFYLLQIIEPVEKILALETLNF